MPQIGPLEILVVSVLALIVFGPEKLPGIARSIGRTMNDLRRMASEVKSEFEVNLETGIEDEPEPADPPKPAEPASAEPAEEGIRADADAPAEDRPR